MQKRHFIVNLKTGEQLVFGGKCNSVEHNERDYIFKHVDGNTYTCLGIVPRENILNVFSIADEN